MWKIMKMFREASARNESITFQNDVGLSCPEQNSNQNDFKQNFKLWALNNGVTHRCLNELIALIKPKYPNNDARTLLGTPRNKVNTTKLENGEMVFWY